MRRVFVRFLEEIEDTENLKVAFFQKVQFVFFKSPNLQKNIPKNYPELEI